MFVANSFRFKIVLFSQVASECFLTSVLLQDACFVPVGGWGGGGVPELMRLKWWSQTSLPVLGLEPRYSGFSPQYFSFTYTVGSFVFETI